MRFVRASCACVLPCACAASSRAAERRDCSGLSARAVVGAGPWVCSWKRSQLRVYDAWIRSNYAEIWHEGPAYFRDGGNPIELSLMRRNPS